MAMDIHNNTRNKGKKMTLPKCFGKYKFLNIKCLICWAQKPCKAKTIYKKLKKEFNL